MVSLSNRDIFIRTMALELVFFMIAAEGAKLGNDILAANAVLLNFLFLIANGLDGLAQAVEAFPHFRCIAESEFWYCGAPPCQHSIG